MIGRNRRGIVKDMRDTGGSAAGRASALLLVSLAYLFLCLLAPFAARAQHYTFAQFGPLDGLLNQDVSAIVQDRRGILWVGTENGLFQADGSHFVKVESYANAAYGSVLAMHVDTAGRVWVLGGKRLVFFPDDGVLHQVPGIDLSLLLDNGVALTSLPDRPNTVFLLRNGHLQQVHSPDGGTAWESSPAIAEPQLAAHPALGHLDGLVADAKRGVLWAGCGQALCELRPPGADAVRASTLATEWDTNRGVPANGWRNLMLARDGRLWARGTGELLRLDPATWAVDRFGDPSGGSDPHVRYGQIAEDLDGSILAIVPDGLARLKDGKWNRLTAQNGLPPSQIVTLFFDRSGGFWLTPIGGGIWRWLGYGNWQHWTSAEGLSSNVSWNMLRDKAGQLWVATNNDLDRIDDAAGGLQGKVVPQHSGAPMRGAQTIAADARGHLWIGTSGGQLMDFDPKTNHTQRVAEGLGFVDRVMEEDALQGEPERVWVCTSSGLGYVSAADHWSGLHPVHDPGAPQANVWGMTQDRDRNGSGALWFSAQGGIYRLANSASGPVWSHIEFPDGARMMNYPMLEAAPDGTLWLQAAMPTPLLHLRVTGNHATILASVSGNMIGSDDISFIKVDRRNWLWVGTDLGVYVSDGRRWVHCTEEDGLISDDTDTASVFEDGDGSMWFGTAGGVSHLLHPAELFRVAAPQISVRDVRLNGIELATGVQPNFNLRDPELSVELFSTYYKRPRAVVFRYQLLGLQNEWQTTQEGSLHFSSLAAGDYTFSVQAMDQRVHAASAPIEYSFTVLPPWYRRDRAKVGGAVLLLLLIAAGWQLSLHRLKTSEANLKRKVDQQTAQLLAEKEHLERTQQELMETSRRDALTGLLNRSAIFEVLAGMRRTALDEGSTLSVIMADLDHFKSINDQCGHAVGDAVLRECAERFKETLRPGDAVGRYGGEELLMAIPGLTPAHAVARIESIREAIAAQAVVHGEHVLQVTCSFGVAWLNERNRDVETVVNAADAALYLAKQNGRNRVEFTPDAAQEAFVVGRC